MTIENDLIIIKHYCDNDAYIIVSTTMLYILLLNCLIKVTGFKIITNNIYKLQRTFFFDLSH